MYIFMFFVFLTGVSALLFPQKKERLDPFESYLKSIRPYAHLSPDLYENFLVSLDTFRDSLNPDELYLAINYLEELTMYHEFDDSIITRLGRTGERLANVTHPRYS